MEPPCFGLFHTDQTPLPFSGYSLKSPKSHPWTCWHWRKFWGVANSEAEGLVLWQQPPGLGRRINRLYLFCLWICLFITFPHFYTVCLFPNWQCCEYVNFFLYKRKVVVIFDYKFNKNDGCCWNDSLPLYCSGAPYVAHRCIFLCPVKAVPQGLAYPVSLFIWRSSLQRKRNWARCTLMDESVEGAPWCWEGQSRERDPLQTDRPQCSDLGQLDVWPNIHQSPFLVACFLCFFLHDEKVRIRIFTEMYPYFCS